MTVFSKFLVTWRLSTQGMGPKWNFLVDIAPLKIKKLRGVCGDIDKVKW